MCASQLTTHGTDLWVRDEWWATMDEAIEAEWVSLSMSLRVVSAAALRRDQAAGSGVGRRGSQVSQCGPIRFEDEATRRKTQRVSAEPTPERSDTDSAAGRRQSARACEKGRSA